MGAGVLPGFEDVASKITKLSGQRLVRFTIPKGAQELMVQ